MKQKLQARELVSSLIVRRMSDEGLWTGRWTDGKALRDPNLTGQRTIATHERKALLCSANLLPDIGPWASPSDKTQSEERYKNIKFSASTGSPDSASKRQAAQVAEW